MNKKCDTIGCPAPATHTLTWRGIATEDATYSEQVCEPCGQGYLRRPALRATLVKVGE